MRASKQRETGHPPGGRRRRRWRRGHLIAGAVVVLACGALATLTSAAPEYADWAAPVSLGPPVNTSVNDLAPSLSADGLTLYIHSPRPGGAGAQDIWFTKRATVDAPWGMPVNVGPVINTAAVENVCSLSPDGHWLFFASNRPGGLGGLDLYQSYRPDVHDDFGWQTPTSLGPNVNSSADEQGNGSVEIGGTLQLFFGSLRSGPPVLSSADIYRSIKQADGTWGPAAPVAELNSPAGDNRPSVRPDGLEIFFQSDRPGGVGGSDIWVSTRATVDAPWSTPVNLGPTVNSSESDQHPGISADGRTLHFGSARGTSIQNFDLWVTTRAAKLTVTADDRSRLFGQANPALTYELTGFVGGETASVVSGTAACSTTATQSSPAGDYPIACTVGSLSAPRYVFETFVAATLTVSYSRPCLTGISAGPLRVAAGEAVCIGAGGSQTGPVTVAPGGALDVEGGRITGPVTANGAAAVRICGATITGPLTIAGSTGPVLVGGAGCDPNTIAGPVRVTDNAGGVEVAGNTVVGPLRVTGNTAPVQAAGNTVTGPATIQS
jgi:hypothetical protein